MKVPPTPPATFILDHPSHTLTFRGALWRVFRTAGPHALAWNELRHYGPIPGMRFDPQPPPPSTDPDAGTQLPGRTPR